jgi:hypothetical protein
VIFEKSEEAFRPIFSRNLQGGYRREVFIAFTDENTLYFEQPKTLERMDVRRRRTDRYPADGMPTEIFIDDEKQLLYMCLRLENNARLDVYTLRGMFLTSYFIPEDASVSLREGSAYMISEGEIRRIDILEGTE